MSLRRRRTFLPHLPLAASEAEAAILPTLGPISKLSASSDENVKCCTPGQRAEAVPAVELDHFPRTATLTRVKASEVVWLESSGPPKYDRGLVPKIVGDCETPHCIMPIGVST